MRVEKNSSAEPKECYTDARKNKIIPPKIICLVGLCIWLMFFDAILVLSVRYKNPQKKLAEHQKHTTHMINPINNYYLVKGKLKLVGWIKSMIKITKENGPLSKKQCGLSTNKTKKSKCITPRWKVGKGNPVWNNSNNGGVMGHYGGEYKWETTLMKNTGSTTLTKTA